MLFLDRQDVVELLPIADCITAVERAFAAHAAGELPIAPGVLGAHVDGGGFHIKTAALGSSPGYFAAKINANFPGNPDRHGLPMIQGMIGLFDSANGRPLALLDSIEITTLRTAAASAVAVQHLARADSSTLAICGCGNQGRAHLRALLQVRKLRRVLAYDRDPSRAQLFAWEMARECAADVHADLGQIVSGRRPGRTSEDQIFIFDSTGTALQDVAAAAMVYERAVQAGRGRRLSLTGESDSGV
jgi:ornithine cyclodeaminase/alanine dehydrogenase-like protein (mu-crystallin family)